MSRLTLRLPETLHQQLAQVAVRKGVSLNQYIVYALTRQTANSHVRGLTIDGISIHSDLEIEQQRSLFKILKDGLGEASPSEISAILAEREIVNSEPDLTTEIVERLQAKLQAD